MNTARRLIPISGETYTPNEPDLLLWVHCTLVWAVLAGCQRWGPALTAKERDRFVDEQRTAARLVGIDPEQAPRSVAELDAYMERMLPHLAYVTSTRFMREMMVPPRFPFTPAGLVQLVMTRAAADLLPEPMQDLYGFRWTWLNHALVSLVSTAIIRTAGSQIPYEKLLPELRSQSAVHAFGRAAKRRTRESRAAVESQAASANSWSPNGATGAGSTNRNWVAVTARCAALACRVASRRRESQASSCGARCRAMP